eukprot:TRINITY_DN6506_c0_g1_i4.p1 TRINITY_DN6506_c0_g1~~TRINITY_DN6506_c0_g1_i4.p1  ORF type:complete len:443 (-),score=70.75 TRINITY_DN6506_c0_g1_i4:32-1360(-)
MSLRGFQGDVYVNGGEATKIIQIEIDPLKGDVSRRLARREIDLLEQLALTNNPNIVKILKSNEETSSNKVVIRMEACSDLDLDKYIRKTWPSGPSRVPEDNALRLMRDLVNGYKDFYKLRIVHRDIKPENVLVHNGVAKIGDLGVARNIDSKNTTTLRGNHLYKAPEVFDEVYDKPESEVYSFGLLLLRMLLGEDFYDEIQRKNRIYEIHRGEVKKFIPDDLKLSEETKDLMYAMLKGQKKDRLKWEDLFEIFDVQKDMITVPQIKININRVLAKMKTSASWTIGLSIDKNAIKNQGRSITKEYMKVLFYLKTWAFGASKLMILLRERNPLITMRLIIVLMIFYANRISEFHTRKSTLESEDGVRMRDILLVERKRIVEQANEYISKCEAYLQGASDIEQSQKQSVAELIKKIKGDKAENVCLLYTSPSPRDGLLSRMPSSA